MYEKACITSQLCGLGITPPSPPVPLSFFPPLTLHYHRLHFLHQHLRHHKNITPHITTKIQYLQHRHNTHHLTLTFITIVETNTIPTGVTKVTVTDTLATTASPTTLNYRHHKKSINNHNTTTHHYQPPPKHTTNTTTSTLPQQQ